MVQRKGNRAPEDAEDLSHNVPSKSILFAGSFATRSRPVNIRRCKFFKSMASADRSLNQVIRSPHIFSARRCARKLPKVQAVLQFERESRSWNDMDHEILVDIIKRLEFRDIILTAPYLCKSWRSALLDSIYPPGEVLDLCLFDHFPMRIGMGFKIYGNYLRLVLDCRQYTKLILPQHCFKREGYKYIAQKLPTLKCLVILPEFGCASSCRISAVFCYWPELTEVHCHVYCLEELGVHCPNIRRLRLYGWIQVRRAGIIANNFPQLEHLDVRGCALSVKALPIIMEGHKKTLVHLDTRHAFHLSDVPRYGFVNPCGKAIEWNEDDVRRKVAGVREYLYCARNSCPECSFVYPPT